MIAFAIACFLPLALLLTALPIVLLGLPSKGARVAPRTRAAAIAPAARAPATEPALSPGPSKPARLAQHV